MRSPMPLLATLMLAHAALAFGQPAPAVPAPRAARAAVAHQQPAGQVQPIVQGQPIAHGQPIVQDQTVASQAMGRDMSYRVLLPAGYDNNARRYPVLYLLHGLTGDYSDWDTRTHLVRHLAPYDLIVVMPDAGNSWYTNAGAPAQDKYEDYVARDLIADVDGKFRTIRTRHTRAVAGLSMGGYGAMKFGLKYPGTFVFAASFSGALQAAHDKEFFAKSKEWSAAFGKIMGPAGGPARAANDIFALAEKADVARLPYLYIDCGTEDGLLKANRDFVAVLQQKKIPYEYRELPGAHTWSYWDQQLPQMLRVLAGHMAIERR